MDAGVEATLAELGISSLDNVVNINFTELKVILSALLSKLGTQSKSIANVRKKTRRAAPVPWRAACAARRPLGLADRPCRRQQSSATLWPPACCVN